MADTPPTDPTPRDPDAGADRGVDQRSADRDVVQRSADRRTLTIGVLAMVGLVAVGLVSAQLFGRSACTRLDAIRLDERRVDADVEVVLDEVLGSAPAASVLAGLDERLGRPVGAAEVTGAQRLTVTDDDIVALGPITTTLGAELTRVRATADLADTLVVGSGDVLYQLVVPNPVTGQVDALRPLQAADLEGSTCVDTSAVGSPLAFLLDAAREQLLLLRLEDDGDDPRIELRDPVVGQVWFSRFDLPTAPAGTAASRVSGLLADDLVVVAAPAADEVEPPSVVAFARRDGVLRWQLDVEVLLSELRAVIDPGPPSSPMTAWPTAMAATDELVLLGLRVTPTTLAEAASLAGDAAGGQAEAAGAGAHGAIGVLVGLDARDGTVRFVRSSEALSAGAGYGEIRTIRSSEQVATLAIAHDGHTGLVDLDLTARDDPVVLARTAVAGQFSGLDRGVSRALAAVDSTLIVLGPDGEVTTSELGVPILDVAVGPTGSLTVLLGDEDAAVAVALRQ